MADGQAGAAGPAAPGARRRFRLVAQGARELAHYRCWNHLQRNAVQRCDKCARLFCAECLAETDWGYVCALCRGQLERRAALDRTQMRRAVFNADLLPVVVVMLLSVVLAGQLVWVAGSVDLRRDLGAKMQLFFEGADPTHGTVVSATAVGGRAFGAQAPAPGYAVENLIDGLNEADLPGWRSLQAAFPQDIVLKLNLRGRIASVDIRQHRLDPPDAGAQRVQIWASDEDPNIKPDGLVLLRDVTLGVGPSWRIVFTPVVARYVLVRVLTNHGNPDFVAIGEIDVRAPPRAPASEAQMLDAPIPRIEP